MGFVFLGEIVNKEVGKKKKAEYYISSAIKIL